MEPIINARIHINRATTLETLDYCVFGRHIQMRKSNVSAEWELIALSSENVLHSTVIRLSCNDTYTEYDQFTKHWDYFRNECI